jgi:hypothetical protein
LDPYMKVFSCFDMVTHFMLKLESEFMKACLLEELWNLRAKSCAAMGSWSSKVGECKSINRLQRLLIELVDATHPQAFLDGWFHSARIKSKEPREEVRHDAKVLLSDTFLPKSEAMRWRWERCKMSNVANLVAKSSKRMEEWIMEIKPQTKSIFARIGKRKQSQREPERTIVQSPVVHMTGCELNISSIDDTDAVEECAIDGLTASLGHDSSARTKVRRRRMSDRVLTACERSEGSSDIPASSESFASTRIDARAKRKIAELESESKVLGMKEVHWPIAGRRLFDPVGYLPKATVRHLARNAGGAFAPFVTYTQLYEVGQVSFAHVWRKRVVRCTSFEELLFLLRTLEAFLDHQVSSSFGLFQFFRISFLTLVI